MVRFLESQKIGGRQGCGTESEGGGIMKTGAGDGGRGGIIETKTGESDNPKVGYSRVRRREGIIEPECGVQKY